MSTVWPSTVRVRAGEVVRARPGRRSRWRRRCCVAVLASLPSASTTIAEPRTSTVMPRRRSSRLRALPSASRTVALRSSKWTPLTITEPKPVIGPLANAVGGRAGAAAVDAAAAAGDEHGERAARAERAGDGAKRRASGIIDPFGGARRRVGAGGVAARAGAGARPAVAHRVVIACRGRSGRADRAARPAAASASTSACSAGTVAASSACHCAFAMLAEGSHRLGRQLVGEHGLLDVRRRVGENVGDAGAQMVADVAGEKAVGALAVARRRRRCRAAACTRVALDLGEAEPAQLVEQAARMDVLRDRARERLEARRRALACAARPARPRRSRRAGSARQRVKTWVAGDGRAGGRPRGASSRRVTSRRVRPVAVATRLTMRCARRFRLRAPRRLDEGRLEQVLDRGEWQAAAHGQHGDRLEQRGEGADQCRRRPRRPRACCVERLRVSVTEGDARRLQHRTVGRQRAAHLELHADRELCGRAFAEVDARRRVAHRDVAQDEGLAPRCRSP